MTGGEVKPLRGLRPKGGGMKEELMGYIAKLTSDDIDKIITHLPRLISELEAQGLPVHLLAPLQSGSNHA